VRYLAVENPWDTARAMITEAVQPNVSLPFPRPIWARNVPHAFYLSELMKLLKAHVLLDIADDLSRLAAWAGSDDGYLDMQIPEGDEVISESLRHLDEVARLCADYGFATLFMETERNRLAIERRCTYRELSAIAENLRNRIQDEYASVLLLWIEEKDYFQKDDLFGAEVGERFKGASFDIKEAGNCYALSRYTACVFHLMRVAESGLKAIGKRVGFSDDRPVWEAVLNYINAEIRRDRDKMSELFKGDLEFIGGIAAHMHAVNIAWRRRVAHVERTYTQEEAKQIFNATKSLMQHLAKNLSE